MPNFLDTLFKTPAPASTPAPAQQQQQQQQQAPANQPGTMDQQHQQQQATGGLPPQSGAPEATPPPAPATPENPLDIYAGLFDNDETGEADNLPPTFAISPDKLQEAASSLDFTAGIDQEVMAKLAEGDLSVLPTLLNHVGQNAYSQALSHGTALTDKFVNQHGAYQAKQVAPMVREQLTSQALAEPATGEQSLDLSNPVVKQAVQQTAVALQQKNPTMSPNQIAQMAKDYHIQLAASMLGANGDALADLPNQHRQQQQQAEEAETDWDEYLG